MKRNVIIVTDGDSMAKKAVEKAACNIGGRCISLSAGNPTKLSGEQILDLIKIAKTDPVVVMVDDRGHNKMGKGEKAMDVIINNKDVEVIGIIAVASNTPKARGVRVDCSIDKYGNIIDKGVDKYGNSKENRIVIGDTVNCLFKKKAAYIVGIGDPGKMGGNDNLNDGCPVITRAMEEIIKHYDIYISSREKNKRKH